MKMPFGKFKGEDVEDVPIVYLKWLWKNVPLRSGLRDSVASVLGIGIDGENRSPPQNSNDPIAVDCKIVCDLIKLGYRELAKRYHPDIGGSNEKMTRLNIVREFLIDASARALNGKNTVYKA